MTTKCKYRSIKIYAEAAANNKYFSASVADTIEAIKEYQAARDAYKEAKQTVNNILNSKTYSLAEKASYLKYIVNNKFLKKRHIAMIDARRYMRSQIAILEEFYDSEMRFNKFNKKPVSKNTYNLSRKAVFELLKALTNVAVELRKDPKKNGIELDLNIDGENVVLK